MATPSVTRELVDLTPKMASDLLAKNPGNRSLADGRVRAMCAEILRGGWVLNGQGIIVDDDGNLLDGQHRCAAVVMAKRAVKTLLVKGISRDAFSTIDSGRSRSGADVLTANGMANGTRMAAALRLAWQYTLGVLGSGASEHRPGNRDIADMAAEYPEIRDSVKFTSRGKHTSNAPCVFLHWATMRGNRSQAEQFWNGVMGGTGLNAGSPALKLRDTLFYNLNTKAKYKARDLLEFCIRAWVCFLAGHETQILKAGILDHKMMMNEKNEVFIPMTAADARTVVQQAVRVKKYAS